MLDAAELRQALRRMRISLSDAEMAALLELFDADASGKVDRSHGSGSYIGIADGMSGV